ncbi:hypothetical protein AOLI_G00079370 [Acnodon oligacanthus]
MALNKGGHSRAERRELQSRAGSVRRRSDGLAQRGPTLLGAMLQAIPLLSWADLGTTRLKRQPSEPGFE